MKLISTIFFVTIFLVACESNDHVRFVNGAVVVQSRAMHEVSVQVDTTGDGVADIEAEVLGMAMRKNYVRGDSMSVDIRKYKHYADPLLK